MDFKYEKKSKKSKGINIKSKRLTNNGSRLKILTSVILKIWVDTKDMSRRKDATYTEGCVTLGIALT